MREHKRVPGSARDWLSRAKGDLALARAPLPEGAFREDLCFHAQQAAEKALKAIYQYHDWPFRYVHDLDVLASGLRENGLSVPREVEQAVALTTYAAEARYPGLSEPITNEEYEQAVSLAHAVVHWAERIIEGGSA